MSLQKEQVHDFIKKYNEGRISRRQFLQALTTVGGVAVAQSMMPGFRLATALAQGAPKQGGTLVAATIDKPVNMDPAFAELYSSMQVYQNVFSKLVYLDRNNNVLPGLAHSWQQLDDSTWEFQIADNAYFHNDEHCTAADVVYTFNRLFDPDLGAPNAVFLTPIEGVEAVDDYTVRISTQPNWGGLLEALGAIVEVVNQKGIEENDPRLVPIGTGPFKFVQWVKDDFIELERWDKYHKPNQPYLDKVIFRAISDDTVRLTGLQTGELNWIEQVPLHRADELRASGDVKANPDGEFFPDMFLINCSKPPFDKVEVRQALQWALHRESIANLVWFGQAAPSAEPVSPSNPWYSGVNVFEGGPDIERAKALLAQAGYEDGLTIRYAAQPQVPTQPLVGQLLEQQLAPAGFRVEVESFESARWFEELFTLNYEITGTYWSATADPGEHCLYPLSHSASPWNFSAFRDAPELDTALEEFRYTLDPEARQNAYNKVVRLHQEHSPQVFMVNFRRTYWTQPNIHGAQTLPTLELRMEDIWIDA